jgi:hypothetical protein
LRAVVVEVVVSDFRFEIGDFKGLGGWAPDRSKAFGETPNAAHETCALPFFNSDGKPFIHVELCRRKGKGEGTDYLYLNLKRRQENDRQLTSSK